jgi:hypothetical protein
MKKLHIIGLAMLVAGCSSPTVRCHGALQPINVPAAIDKASHEQGATTSGSHP